eukprot:1161221-Pelagomonas_calceolata.AAC.4
MLTRSSLPNTPIILHSALPYPAASFSSCRTWLQTHLFCQQHCTCCLLAAWVCATNTQYTMSLCAIRGLTTPWACAVKGHSASRSAPDSAGLLILESVCFISSFAVRSKIYAKAHRKAVQKF